MTNADKTYWLVVLIACLALAASGFIMGRASKPDVLIMPITQKLK